MRTVAFRVASVGIACLLLVGATAYRVSVTAPIADAAMRGDVAAMRTLISQHADVNAAQGDGMTALHWAAEHGDMAMTSLLLGAKASVKAVTRIGGYTPLHIASRNGNGPVVAALLKAGSDPNATTASGATALHFAASSGNVAAVTALLDHKADANARESEWGQTPLVFAAAADRGDVIRVLLKRGADASIRTKSVNLTEQAAQEQAATRKRNEVMTSFLPPDTTKKAVAPPPVAADPAAQGGRGGGAGGGGGGRGGGGPNTDKLTPTQIQQAIAAGRELLTAPPPAKATPDAITPADTADGQVAGYAGSVGSMGGMSALHHAVRQGNIDAAMALVEGGANINETTSGDSTTPLLMATINGQFDVAMRLIAHGANVNLASTAGATPLYTTINTQWAPKTRYPQPEAIQNQKTTYLEVMDALLKAGANPNTRLKANLWYFAYNNCGNANCGLESLDGTTPFWRATYSVDVDAMRMLVKYGADTKLPSQRSAGAGGRGGRGGGGRGGPPGAAGGRGGAAAGAANDSVVAAAGRGGANAGGAGRGGRGGRAGGRGGAAGAAAGAATDTSTTAAASPAGPRGGGGGGGGGGGRGGPGGPPAVPLDPEIDSASKAVPPGIGVYPIHAAAGVGYGNGFAGNSHHHAPDGWMPAMKYLVEELGADVNQRDLNGYTPMHHAAARGDNEMILYLVSKGADPKAVARNGRTTVDMANGPVQRMRPFPETIALLEKLGAHNSHKCVACSP